MPVYEYECDRCGVFEATQRITQSPLKKCPTCKSKVHKLISQTSFQLKGTGWYVTDYAGKNGASKGNGKGNGKEHKEAAKEAEISTATKTESKTESKTETKTKSKDAPTGTSSSSKN